MKPSHIVPLRRMLEDIDARLLELLTGRHPLDDATLRRAATLEIARSAVGRLLAAAGKESES